MRQLTVIRHAKSSWKSPAGGDFGRPLNTRGRRDAPHIAALLRALGVTFDWLMVSDAQRTLETAALLVAALSIDESHVHADPGLYLASATHLLDSVRALPSEYPRAALVSHNPGVTELVNLLAPAAGIDDMPTMAAAVLTADVSTWGDLRPGSATLLHYIYPKQFTRD